MSGNHAGVPARDRPAAGGILTGGGAGARAVGNLPTAAPDGIPARAALAPCIKEFGNHSCAKGIPEATPVLSVAGVAPVGYALR